ncbi:MAG: hypothetical protein QXL91_01910, partial [Candidatus Bathyarchaeia archaeon]
MKVEGRSVEGKSGRKGTEQVWLLRLQLSSYRQPGRVEASVQASGKQVRSLMGNRFLEVGLLSRYVQLADFLKAQGAESLALSFGEIERLLGSPLPPSARKLRVWWSNDATHAQAWHGWLQAGWRV